MVDLHLTLGFRLKSRVFHRFACVTVAQFSCFCHRLVKQSNTLCVFQVLLQQQCDFPHSPSPSLFHSTPALCLFLSIIAQLHVTQTHTHACFTTLFIIRNILNGPVRGMAKQWELTVTTCVEIVYPIEKTSAIKLTLDLRMRWNGLIDVEAAIKWNSIT